MKSEFIKLPSNKVVQITDIIYVSEVKENESKLTQDEAYFKVTWANRSTEKFSYKTFQDADDDHNILINVLLDNKGGELDGIPVDRNMICS